MATAAKKSSATTVPNQAQNKAQNKAQKTAQKRASLKKAAGAGKPSTAQHCWPGFEPTPGKAAGEKGSCEPKPGKQTKAVRKADQKAAAASKLQKANSR